MPKLTLDLPEEAYRDALALEPSERVRVFAAAVRHARLEDGDDPDMPDYDRPTNEDDLEAIGRGIQAAAEGRTTSGEVFFARLREQARSGRTMPK